MERHSRVTNNNILIQKKPNIPLPPRNPIIFKSESLVFSLNHYTLPNSLSFQRNFKLGLFEVPSQLFTQCITSDCYLLDL